MSDKELLELAARAAGWSSFDWLRGDGALNVYDKDGRHDAFNPLNDDGDALRLAVKLKLSVDTESCCARDSKLNGSCDDDWFGGGDDEHAGVSHDECDPYAVTRRAIVRAAASIGKELK